MLHATSGCLQLVSTARVPPLSVQVPSLWLAQSFPSLRPLASYMADLLARIAWFNAWAAHGQPPVFWISGFYFTPSFTTAVLQNFARRQSLPIDEIGFDFEVLDQATADIKHAPPDGAYIHGLYLDGCGWDHKSQQLTDSQPKASHKHSGFARPRMRV